MEQANLAPLIGVKRRAAGSSPPHTLPTNFLRGDLEGWARLRSGPNLGGLGPGPTEVGPTRSPERRKFPGSVPHSNEWPGAAPRMYTLGHEFVRNSPEVSGPTGAAPPDPPRDGRFRRRASPAAEGRGSAGPARTGGQPPPACHRVRSVRGAARGSSRAGDRRDAGPIDDPGHLRPGYTGPAGRIYARDRVSGASIAGRSAAAARGGDGPAPGAAARRLAGNRIAKERPRPGFSRPGERGRRWLGGPGGWGPGRPARRPGRRRGPTRGPRADPAAPVRAGPRPHPGPGPGPGPGSVE